MGSNKITLSQQHIEELFLKQGLVVLEPYVNSRTRIKSECLSCGKIVSPLYRQIWAGQSGCRDCSSSKFRLTDEQLDRLLKKRRLKKDGDYTNSKTPFECVCLDCGTKTQLVIANFRDGASFNCSGCNPAGITRKKKQTVKESEIVRQIFYDYGFLLIGTYVGATKKVATKHLACGAINEMSLKTIKQGSGFCLSCMKNKKLSDKEALDILVKAGFTPLEPYVNSDTPWKSKCVKCERILSPTVHVLKTKKSGCAFCNGVKIDPDEAERIMILAGFTPLDKYRNNKSKWKCRHDVCGKIVYPRFNSIQQGQGGCTSCSDGFSYHEVSYFYLMIHENHQSLKIGISNSGSRDNRTKRHEKTGWRLIQKIEFENGWLAYEMEQTLLSEIRGNRNAPIHLSKVEMPQGGYSETISIEMMSLLELEKLVKRYQLGML